MKRTKRKNIWFSGNEWSTVCRKAKRLEMKPATFIRNMTLCDKWIDCDVGYICALMQKVNRVGTELKMIIRVAESTNPEHLEKLRELKKRFDEYRNNFIRYYSQLMNRGVKN